MEVKSLKALEWKLSEDEQFTWRWLFKWYRVRPGIPISFMTVLGVASAIWKDNTCISGCSQHFLPHKFQNELGIITFLYSLSAPPSWVTASTNLSWRSGVHFSLGFASVDRTSPESPGPLPPWRNKCLSEGIDILEEGLMFFPRCWLWWYMFSFL